jgi:hypothetical protein
LHKLTLPEFRLSAGTILGILAHFWLSVKAVRPFFYLGAAPDVSDKRFPYRAYPGFLTWQKAVLEPLSLTFIITYRPEKATFKAKNAKKPQVKHFPIR